jgi:hypothetical protein
MDTEELFSRADLCRLSGAPEDAVVFWLRQSLLAGQQRNPRAHLRFAQREVMLAALLNEMRRLGLNIGAMRAVIYQLRHAFDLYDPLPKVRFWVDMLNLETSALDGELDVLRERWDLTEDHLDQLRAVHSLLPTGRSQEVWLAVDFYDEHGSLVIWVDDEGCWHLTNSVEDALSSGGRSALLIDTGRICSELAADPRHAESD